METIIETPEKESKLSNLANEAKTAFDKPQKKRGRPPGSKKTTQSETSQTEATKPQFQGPPTKDIIKPLVNVLSVGVAGWIDDERAIMKPQELDSAATALGMLIDKWMPNVLDKYGPEVMCLMVFGQYGIRVMALKKVKAIDKILEEEKRQNQDLPREPQTQNPFSSPQVVN